MHDPLCPSRFWKECLFCDLIRKARADEREQASARAEFVDIEIQVLHEELALANDVLARLVRVIGEMDQELFTVEYLHDGAVELYGQQQATHVASLHLIDDLVGQIEGLQRQVTSLHTDLTEWRWQVYGPTPEERRRIREWRDE